MLTFHVSFVIEIRHLPAIFLIIVIMSIRAVMGWRYRFGIRCWRTIIEIYLGAILIGRWSKHLLWLLLSGSSVKKKDISLEIKY